MEEAPKGYHRLFPGNRTRLKYGYVIECTGCEKDADGRITAVLAELVPDTKSGTPGADSVKVKGVITWVSATEGLGAEVSAAVRPPVHGSRIRTPAGATS
jgi:glutaminyl-tRNA synthetase